MDHLTAKTIQEVLRHYAIGELVDARNAQSGYINQNWVLETTRGCYFLKCRHPDLRNAGVIRAQHALVMRLREKGFPAPSVLPTTAADGLLVLDGEYFEIQQYIEHSGFDRERAAHLDAAARTLAQYHRTVDGFTAEALCADGELYHPSVASGNLARLTDLWNLRKNPAYTDQMTQLETHVTDLTERFATHVDLPHLVIHGDYYADNLLVDGDSIVGVVDYDKARWQARVAELAEALIYFASPRQEARALLVYPGSLKQIPFSRFLRTYAQGIAVAEAEARALPDYVRAIWLSVSLRRLGEITSRPPSAENTLAELQALVGWAKDNAQRMTSIAGQATRLGLSESPTHRRPGQ